MQHAPYCWQVTPMTKKHLADRVASLTSSATVSLPDKAKELKKAGVDVIDLSDHTGWLPILFSYREPITDMLEPREPRWTKTLWIA